MAVTSKDMHTAPPWAGHPGTAGAHINRLRRTWRGIHFFIGLAAALLALVALYLVMSSAVDVGQRWLDDLRYGRPRTTHLTGFVGHNEISGQPSHFIGLNLQRQVVVVQLPGGDPAEMRTLPGPYLFGASEDLTPVDLALRDIDGDSYVDLLVTVRNERVVYLNKDGDFRLPTPAEQQRLAQPPAE